MKLKTLIILLCVIILTGCIERTGYYTDGEEKIISLICDITWATSKYECENDESGQTTYKFNTNGTYKRTDYITDISGEIKTAEYNGYWSFNDPSFSTIYFGGNLYWDIKELTENIFAFYDRTGEIGEPTMVREYRELTPFEQAKSPN